MQQAQSDIKSWLWVLALIVVLQSWPAAARAEGPTPNEMQSGSLLLRLQNGFDTATLLNTDVDMKVSGLVARVSVRQKFRNTSKEWVEGVYVFPLPDSACCILPSLLFLLVLFLIRRLQSVTLRTTTWQYTDVMWQIVATRKGA